jgi:hypothetical protein
MLSILKLFGIYQLYKNHKLKFYSIAIWLFSITFMTFFTADIVAILEKNSLEEYIVYPYAAKWLMISSFFIYLVFGIKKFFITKKEEDLIIKDDDTKAMDINILNKDKLLSKADLIIAKKKTKVQN